MTSHLAKAIVGPPKSAVPKEVEAFGKDYNDQPDRACGSVCSSKEREVFGKAPGGIPHQLQISEKSGTRNEELASTLSVTTYLEKANLGRWRTTKTSPSPKLGKTQSRLSAIDWFPFSRCIINSGADHPSIQSQRQPSSSSDRLHRPPHRRMPYFVAQLLLSKWSVE